MSATVRKRVLLVGIGNDSRGDDGLGWQFLQDIEALAPEVEVAYRYQLQVEDADVIRPFDVVVFVDATRTALADGFSWQPCKPVADISFSTHRQEPGTILYLARELFGSGARGYVLAISGYTWALGEGLSVAARENLSRAKSFLLGQLNNQLQPA